MSNKSRDFMKKTTFFIINLLLIFGINTVFSQTGTRVVESSGNFSWQPPMNWTVSEFPGLKYMIAFGQIEEGFAVNINIVDEAYSGTLRSYVDQSIVQLRTFLQEFRLLERADFMTNSGIIGEKVTINAYQQGFFLRQILYFIPNTDNTIFIMIGSVPENVSTNFLTIFDESIKTFEFLK